jgi:hypothetical protein
MKNSKDLNFSEEIESIKARLPKTYIPLLEHEGFRFKKGDVYNVLHRGVRNKEILKALKTICKG